ncbi:MAG: hypoxanthine phosphoribosyltransferase [Planctomycetota bacterium]|jgi:hypoxanthine phosphoribosyltransferase
MTEVLYSADRIAARVRELAGEIRDRYPDDPLTLLGILTGSVIFTADLARVVGEPVELSFVHARSYGSGTTSSGEVTLGDLELEVLRDHTVIVTDTILDTGRTLHKVVEAVQAAGPREVATCVLLDKPARRVIEVEAGWVGFEVPDRFLVGYGLDHAGRYRTLEYVGVLEEDPHG